MKFRCPECGHIHRLSGVIEEAEMNGYAVSEVEEQCPECGDIVTFERAVEEL